MKKTLGICIATLTLGAWADGHDAKTYVYGTYANCDITAEEAADKTFEKHYAPAYEASLEAGEIIGWGFLKHHTGGTWRRLSYHMANGLSEVLAATDKYSARIEETLSPRNDKYGQACQTHEDYIWESKFGNATEERGTIGISVYHVCDMSRESRADELVETEFAEAYDSYLGEGKLTSWGWMSHVVGGKYRRITTMSAANVDDLLKARAELLEKFAGSAAAREFTSICGSHMDQIWDIAMEGRKATD